ncbi:sugar phosphate isomerase/epimerase [Geomicrobium halophilum]|uniref:Sugar phosphate isomerase/epimerase n=1 Tax=Geomicrobium halophilum TaxID=549000 RepID=A0A841PR48_9BACL|nr:sugar phosphate isomerase/epimerase [Geomicrobium halophilum]
MKFSICSWTFGEKPIEDIIKFASKVGYDEIEVHAAVDAYDWNYLREKAKDENIDIRGLSGDAEWLQEETDMAHSDPKKRRLAVEYFKKQVEAAEIVQAEYIVVSPSAPGKAVPLGNGEEDWVWAIESIQELAPFAQTKGVDLIIEPLNRYESCILNNAKQAKAFVEEVAAPNVKTMLDTFHMNIEETNLTTPFVELGEALGHIHVADTNRRGLGRGRLPFDEVAEGIKQSGYNGTITVECLAPGPDPFEANKTEESMEWIYTYAEETLHKLHQFFK